MDAEQLFTTSRTRFREHQIKQVGLKQAEQGAVFVGNVAELSGFLLLRSWVLNLCTGSKHL